MDILVREESFDVLDEYARIPISFDVRSFLVVKNAVKTGALSFEEVPHPAPFTKDYDAISGTHPSDWPRRFDLSTWGLICAWRDDTRIGGIVIAQGTHDVDLLEGRTDLAVLWDLRVSPGDRGHGIGSRLLASAETWARSRGCQELKVETQNINVAACRFYQATGFSLDSIDPEAYPDLPGETQLMWRKALV